MAKDGDVDYYDCEGSDDACQDRRCNDEFCLIDEKWNYISQASVVDPNKLQNTTSQALIILKQRRPILIKVQTWMDLQ